MHGNGIRADPVQGRGEPWTQCFRYLSEADIADQQDVRCQVADLEADRRPARGGLVAEHDALGAQHHADTQLLGRAGQIAIDGASQFGSAGHRADQHRGAQGHAEEAG